MTTAAGAARLMVWQARERWPLAWAPLGGAFAHAIEERLETPATFCFALCGASGFADHDADEDDRCCLRCQRRLTVR
jgi:hypothetical protein